MSKPEFVRKGATADPAAIFAFLWLDGQDYRNYPLVVRKGLLRHVLQGDDRTSETFSSS